MKRHGRILIAALALSIAPLPALAQPVFFDDFDGNALLPHWIQPPASHWEYNVSNSMLNVTNLLFPSHPKIPVNSAYLTAPFAPQQDFQIDAWMGWDMGASPHKLGLRVLGPFGANPILAEFGYWWPEGFSEPQIFASASNQGLFLPAPSPGNHHFTITRIGTQVSFFLDGVSVASFSGTSGITAAYIGFQFQGPYPGQFGAFHIDRLVVVPAPSAAILVAAGLSFNRRRALRRN